MAKIKRIHPKGNAQLLTLLNMGCRIEFNDEAETAMRGDVLNKYIDVYVYGKYQGCWMLNEEGLKEALDDLHKMRVDEMEELREN